MRISIAVLVLASCTSSAKDDVTIDTGVYGALTSSDSGAGGTPFASADITAYAAGAEVGRTTSDAGGRYELALVPGSYELCALGAAPASIYDQWEHNCAGKCTFVDVGDAPVRRDWAANLSGGMWDDDSHCPH